MGKSVEHNGSLHLGKNNFFDNFGQFLPDGIDSGLIPPRPDRFGPRRQRRPNQRPRRPTSNLDFDVMNGNTMLSQAYGRSWFRSNFEDIFSYRGAQKLEWFEVVEGSDCSPVPAVVNAGRPPRAICTEATVDERRCICIKTGR